MQKDDQTGRAIGPIALGDDEIEQIVGMLFQQLALGKMLARIITRVRGRKRPPAQLLDHRIEIPIILGQSRRQPLTLRRIVTG